MKKAVCLLGLATSLITGFCFAQVPPALAGNYMGSGTTLSYFGGPKADKSPVTLLLTIAENGNASIVAVSTGENPPVNQGTAVFANGLLFLSFPVAGNNLVGGRFTVKGKPGKQTASGTFHQALSGFLGLIETSVKFKKLP